MEDWLCVRPDENPVLLTEPPVFKHSRREKYSFSINSKGDRFSELLFEKFQVPGLMMYKDAALTCFARGRTIGMVVDMGEEFTRCCGVIDGFVSRENVSMQRFGGARLRDLYLSKSLQPFLESRKEEKERSIIPRGMASISPSGKIHLLRSIGREMNEKLFVCDMDWNVICRSVVSENPYVGMESPSSTVTQKFTLPDGRTVFTHF